MNSVLKIYDIVKTAIGALFLLCILSSCQSVPKNFQARRSVAFQNTEKTWWGRYFSTHIKKHPGQSGFYPLQSGLDALVARLESIRRAEKSIDVQYYIWHDDSVGQLVWNELLTAAQRGVRVRVLLDDLNIGPYQESLLVLDSHPNIEVRMFNPFAHRIWRVFDVFRFSEINRRMHNKSLIVDNQAVIIGGRNIGKEYFTASADANFGDFDIWCFGPVVNESSQSFDLYWNDRLAIPVSILNKRAVKDGELSELSASFVKSVQELRTSGYETALLDSDLAHKIKKGKITAFWGKAKIFSDSPAKIRGEESDKNPPMLNQMTALPIHTKKEIFIISPYFIPGKNGVHYFAKKVSEGVRVEVLTNSLASNDVGLVFAGYKKYRKSLVRGGVHLYEFKPRASVQQRKTLTVTSGARLGLHGKVYIFDRRYMFVGSMNLDPRSVDLNSELGVLLESPELANAFVAGTLREIPEIAYAVSFDNQERLQWKTLEDGQAVTLQQEPEASWWKSFKASFLSLFVPESLL